MLAARLHRKEVNIRGLDSEPWFGDVSENGRDRGKRFLSLGFRETNIPGRALCLYMARQARVVVPEVPYHVTQRGTNREAVFRSDSDYRAYLDLVGENALIAGVRISAFCLMPNHVHWVLRPESEDSLGILFRRVHGRYSQYFNFRTRRTGHLWQGRYYSCPMDKQHWLTAMQYVEWNPVRAGLVPTAGEYPYSSARAHLEGVSAFGGGLLDWEMWKQVGGRNGWKELIGNPSDPRLEKRLRKCTASGAPFGAESFVKEIEEASGRVWRKQGQT